MNVAELQNFLNADLTMSCSLPQILPDLEIQRLIATATSWFYENYQYSLIKGYLYIPHSTLLSETFTRYKYIVLPETIQNLVWVYQLANRSVFELGWGGSPNLSIGVGVTTNQQYLSSSLTSIGELGVYKVIIDGFANQLNKLSKTTLKYDFNFGSKQLHLLTNVHGDLVLEAYQRIPEEDLFEMDKFRRYVLALCKLQLGRMLLRYNFQLPGEIQINGEAIRAEGDAEIKEVRDEIKAQSQNAFFFTTN